MGRKRLDKVKKTYGVSMDPDLWDALTKDGVNKSRLFSISAKKYLRRKAKNQQNCKKVDK